MTQAIVPARLSWARSWTRTPRPGLRLPAQVLCTLALVAIGTALHLGVVSQLAAARSQQVAHAELRTQLAIGTAPVAQYDSAGVLLPLGTPLAILEVPRLGLSQVVVEGTTAGALTKGPGHRRDTVLPGQAGTSVVLGRRLTYGGPFRDLASLSFGDRIRTTTGQGKAVYRVTAIRRAGDPLPSPIVEGAGRLTLVTGDGDWWAPSGVVRVDAVLESEPQPGAPRVVSAAVLSSAEQVMAVDGGAVVPLLLWTELLVLAAGAAVYARAKWGGRQAWVVGVPVLVLLGITVAGQVARLLPNLI